MGARLDDHEKEVVVMGLLILNEAVHLTVSVKLVSKKLPLLRNNVLYLLVLLVRAEAYDLDLVVVGKEQMLVAQTDMLD